MESEAALIGRIDELWAQIQYSPHSRIALVGHSHFFRFLLRRHLDAGASLLAANGSEADASTLSSQKLSNGGCVRCEVDFGGKSPTISSAQLLFDTILID
jgi:broad specificity phosphatase PhoE